MKENVVLLRPEFPVLKFHPLADILPLMEGTEYEDLVASIRLRGQRDPIVLFEGMILDGRNRYRACRDAYIQTGKLPNITALEDVAGEDADPRKYVADKNLLRRHLSVPQRAMYMAQLATYESGYPKSRSTAKHTEKTEENHGGSNEPPSNSTPALTNAEAGAIALVSESAIKDAKVVLSEGSEEEKQGVIGGDLGLRPTADQIRARRPANPNPSSENAEAAPAGAAGLTGARLGVPAGKTASQWCLEGMAFEQAGKGADQAAKLIGMPINSYREVRDIVLLATRVELTAKDQKHAKSALKLLDETRLLARSHEMVKPIAERLWGVKGQRRGGENRRLEEFEDAVSTIVSVLMKARDLNLPYLTEERAEDIAKRLKDGRSSLMDLIRSIEGSVK